MDGMGTIKFELDKVSTFGSTKHFQIVLRSGMQNYGSFDNKPVSTDASTADNGITTTLSFSFH